MNSEQIIQSYISGNETGADNRLKAAVGDLSARKSEELTKVLGLLKLQISLSSSDLKDALSLGVNDIIESNERLSRSNESYTKWIKWLTFGLVIVGLLQASATIFAAN